MAGCKRFLVDAADTRRAGTAVVVIIVAVCFLAAVIRPVQADEEASRAEIAAALTKWTADFNARRGETVCDLFARELRADFGGLPERGYDAQCALLQTALADRTRTFSYALALREILVWGDVAVVRLTWTLTVRQNDTGVTRTTVEPGLDVFRRQSDGRWRIVRYIAYEK